MFKTVPDSSFQSYDRIRIPQVRKTRNSDIFHMEFIVFVVQENAIATEAWKESIVIVITASVGMVTGMKGGQHVIKEQCAACYKGMVCSMLLKLHDDEHAH